MARRLVLVVLFLNSLPLGIGLSWAGWPEACLPEQCRFVDCEHGSDANDGLTPGAAMRSLNGALQQLPAFDPTQLYILAGNCPSEGGVHLQFATDIYGAGINKTEVADAFHFYWSTHSDPELDGLREGHTFEDLALGEVHGNEACCVPFSAGEVALQRVKVRRVSLQFDFFADLRVTDSQVDDVDLMLGGFLFSRNSRIGQASAWGMEDGGVDIADSTIGDLWLGDKAGGTIARTVFTGGLGTTLRFEQNTYAHTPPGSRSLRVTDSVFTGSGPHIWVTCLSVNNYDGCGDVEIAGNTFVDTVEPAVRTDGYDPMRPVHTGNAFSNIGSQAIQALGTPPPVVNYNNFDTVGDALCVGATCFATGADVNASNYGGGNKDNPSGFISPGDYRLSASSQLIDVGDPMSVGTDRDGLPRPFDGDFDGMAIADIGAYEFTDPDQDGWTSPLDNCIAVANSDQSDADADEIGDACDPCTDTDSDGFGDPGFPVSVCELDNCPVDGNPDQADSDADGAGDACDSCTDVDQDGFGNGALGNASCGSGPAIDCDDVLPTVYPGAPQACDGLPNDCLDPLWPTVPANEADADEDGFRTCAGDCDDSLAFVFPGEPELCNALDDDCDTFVDEDDSGVDSDLDSVANACDNCRLAFNPDQLDADVDGVGSACDNCFAEPNSDQTDTDSDGRGDACDNCPLSFNPFQDDWDVDARGDTCDNCPVSYNPTQGDFDADDEGDVCDLNDGLILLFTTDPDYQEWQSEEGYSSWNAYKGDLEVLKATGVYTQAPGSNDLARKQCGLGVPWLEDFTPPGEGRAAFFLTTGVNAGGEGNLGTDSAGTERPNANPCP